MKFYFRAQSSAHRLVWSGISTEPFCIFHATFEPQGGRTVCRRGWSGVAAELAELALVNQVPLHDTRNLSPLAIDRLREYLTNISLRRRLGAFHQNRPRLFWRNHYHTSLFQRTRHFRGVITATRATDLPASYKY